MSADYKGLNAWLPGADADPVKLVEALGPVCKKHGIKRLRLASGLEIEFGAGGDVDKSKVKEFQDTLNQGVPSDEEVLFHSAPGYAPVPKENP